MRASVLAVRLGRLENFIPYNRLMATTITTDHHIHDSTSSFTIAIGWGCRLGVCGWTSYGLLMHLAGGADAGDVDGRESMEGGGDEEGRRWVREASHLGHGEGNYKSRVV